jgi:superfamily I DNA/RNA helicase
MGKCTSGYGLCCGRAKLDDVLSLRWRNASHDHWPRMMEQFPSHQLLSLRMNYRSTRNVLHAANALLSRDATTGCVTSNPDGMCGHAVDWMCSSSGTGLLPFFMECKSLSQEIARVALSIVTLLEQSRGLLRFEDFAVLFRTRSPYG